MKVPINFLFHLLPPGTPRQLTDREHGFQLPRYNFLKDDVSLLRQKKNPEISRRLNWKITI